jgi:guanosine-3',5'-bis(diphosphate) 3'-pyrophosphohydrolase
MNLKKMKAKINVVEVAREFAEIAHGKQKYDGRPYTEAHLDKVVANIDRHTHDPVILAMGYLHDVLEDTEVEYDELAFVFGHTIANGVLALTDKKGSSRFERQLVTYSNLRDNKDALLVKLCDRITNMQASFGTKHAITYINEYERFKGSLYSEKDDFLVNAWDHLDGIYKALKEDLARDNDKYLKIMRNDIPVIYSFNEEE